MSDTNDMTEQLSTMPDSEGCAPPVDNDNGMTPSMHKVSVQEVASSLDATESTSVNKINGVAVWYSVGAYFDQQPAAPHRSPVNAGSSITGMLEEIERDSTENLAEPSLARDEAENGSNVSNESTVWNSIGASFATSQVDCEGARGGGKTTWPGRKTWQQRWDSRWARDKSEFDWHSPRDQCA